MFIHTFEIKAWREKTVKNGSFNGSEDGKKKSTQMETITLETEQTLIMFQLFTEIVYNEKVLFLE